jgi:hypothetical protein
MIFLAVVIIKLGFQKKPKGKNFMFYSAESNEPEEPLGTIQVHGPLVRKKCVIALAWINRFRSALTISNTIFFNLH